MIDYKELRKAMLEAEKSEDWLELNEDGHVFFVSFLDEEKEYWKKRIEAREQRLAKLKELNAPQVILDNETRMLGVNQGKAEMIKEVISAYRQFHVMQEHGIKAPYVACHLFDEFRFRGCYDCIHHASEGNLEDFKEKCLINKNLDNKDCPFYEYDPVPRFCTYQAVKKGIAEGKDTNYREKFCTSCEHKDDCDDPNRCACFSEHSINIRHANKQAEAIDNLLKMIFSEDSDK